MNDAVVIVFCVIFVWGPVLAGIGKLVERFRREYR